MLRFLEDHKWDQFTRGRSQKFILGRSLEERMVALRARSFRQRSTENVRVGGILMAATLLVFTLSILLLNL